VLLGLSVGVAVSRSSTEALPYAALLLVLGAIACRPGDRTWALASTAAEALAVGLALVRTGWADSPFLPYLIAPAFTGGLTSGVLGGVLPVGVTAALLLIVPLVDPGTTIDQELSSDLAQWIVLAVLVAIVASWVRAVLLQAQQSGRDVRAAQREAVRLLQELKNVARELPGTLDPTTAAEAMLGRARDVARVDVGVVLVPVSGGGERLHVMARVGPRRPLDLRLGGEGPLAEVWSTRQPVVLGHRLPAPDARPGPGSACLLPLVSDGRTVGLVLLESGVANAFPGHTLEDLHERVDELAIQLQTGLIFDEVRELATVEERRRLSREIHDGIAQELASIAYALDTAAQDLEPGHQASAQVNDVRDAVRRLVTELRMSLFDLRSEVGPDEGLGAAIGRHVRAVGAAAGLTVHLSLNESPERLAAETEAELLRIVQEAVANARRHAQARNLWVTCTVDPPTASVVVEDDGRGLADTSRQDSHGLAIMRERAARVRGQLVVETRLPRGTRVGVTVGRVPS
jgi:signal transduction histidine kinase